MGHVGGKPERWPASLPWRLCLDHGPEVIGSSVALVPTNAPAVTDQSLESCRLPGTDPHDAQLDYFRIATRPVSGDSPSTKAARSSHRAGIQSMRPMNATESERKTFRGAVQIHAAGLHRKAGPVR